MKESRLLGAVCACASSIVFQSTLAAPVSGQGTWETTLQGRDLDGNAATFEAYYDTTLDITWLADASASGNSTNWFDLNSWAEGLDVNGITGWRLPTDTLINGSSYNGQFTTNATSDYGYADSAGWVDDSGNPASEMGHMYYVTLGNLGKCSVDGGDGDPTTCDGYNPPGWGLTNTGPFSNLLPDFYYSGKEINPRFVLGFLFGSGTLGTADHGVGPYAWAVHSGDVSAVPVPAAAWLFGSGLLGLIGVAKRKKTQST